MHTRDMGQRDGQQWGGGVLTKGVVQDRLVGRRSSSGRAGWVGVVRVRDELVGRRLRPCSTRGARG